MRGTGAQRQFWVTGNVGNDNFDFGQHGNNQFSRSKTLTNKMLIMLCKFVNKMYIKSHDLRKNMVSERGGEADQKKKKK